MNWLDWVRVEFVVGASCWMTIGCVVEKVLSLLELVGTGPHWTGPVVCFVG